MFGIAHLSLTLNFAVFFGTPHNPPPPPQGYDSVTMDTTALSELWCEDRAKWARVLGPATANATYACADMSLQVRVVTASVPA